MGDMGLIATGLPGRSVADAGSIPPMAADRSALLRTAIVRAFATVAMTMWLTLLLLCSAWTRPIGETARVWVCSLPLFLLLDFIRHKTAPDRGAYLAWLGPALAAAPPTDESVWALRLTGTKHGAVHLVCTMHPKIRDLFRAFESVAIRYDDGQERPEGHAIVRRGRLLPLILTGALVTGGPIQFFSQHAHARDSRHPHYELALARIIHRAA
jgi:hypothetical protein